MAKATAATKAANTQLIPSWVNLSSDVARSTVSSTVGVFQDIRNEAKESISAIVDCGDAISKSWLRLTRKLVDRANGYWEAIGDGIENTTVNTVDVLKSNAEEVGGLAGRTVTSVVGGAKNGKATTVAAA